jgi:hypothetical protein
MVETQVETQIVEPEILKFFWESDGESMEAFHFKPILIFDIPVNPN